MPRGKPSGKNDPHPGFSVSAVILPIIATEYKPILSISLNLDENDKDQKRLSGCLQKESLWKRFSPVSG